MISYWETRRGLKRGEVPNRADLLYLSYVRFCKSNALEVESVVVFRGYLAQRGYKKASVAGRRCWLLNKSIVPRSALRLKD